VVVVVVEVRDGVGGEVMMEGSPLAGEEAFERLGEVEKAGFLPNVPCAL
jgi:hypothetical protein